MKNPLIYERHNGGDIALTLALCILFLDESWFIPSETEMASERDELLLRLLIVLPILSVSTFQTFKNVL